MFDQKQTKALFRYVLAYSGGRQVPVFHLEQDLMRDDLGVKAIAISGAALTVAVVKSADNPYSDVPKPELLAAAYEIFINDGDLDSDEIEWVRLNQA